MGQKEQEKNDWSSAKMHSLQKLLVKMLLSLEQQKCI